MAADGQTIIRFGEVYIYRCQTKTFQQRPVMDAAGVGLKNWRYTISVSGHLHAWPNCKYLEVITSPSLDPPDLASTVDKRVRWRLAPRQSFEMAVGCTDTTIASGTVLLSANPMTTVTSTSQLTAGLSNYDVDDGPRCVAFDVTHISGDSLFKVEATFEVNVVHCADDGGALYNTTGVLAHRWGCTDTLNHNAQTIRTYRGFLQLATSQFSPHWFRYLVVPPLAPGMRREHMEFHAAEDGKTLQYSVTDLSIAQSAPAPARKWRIQHTETSLASDALKSTGQVAVTLEGQDGDDKGELISLGLYVVAAKLLGARPDGTVPAGREAFGPCYMNDITISDEIGDNNIVHVSASCYRLARSDGALAGLAVFGDGFKTELTSEWMPSFVEEKYQAYDPKRSAGGYDGQSPSVEGPIPLAGIFRCYLQSPCTGGGSINPGDNQSGASSGTTTAALMPSATVEVVPTLNPEDPIYYSTSQVSNPYIHYEMESEYRDRSMRVALPVAGVGDVAATATAVARLASGQSRRIVYIQAERVGAQPEFPDGESLDDGYATEPSGYGQVTQHLLQSKLLSKTTTRSANGEKLYTCKWAAIYALSRTPTRLEKRRIGTNKWANDGPETTDYNSTGAFSY